MNADILERNLMAASALGRLLAERGFNLPQGVARRVVAETIQRLLGTAGSAGAGIIEEHGDIEPLVPPGGCGGLGRTGWDVLRPADVDESTAFLCIRLFRGGHEFRWTADFATGEVRAAPQIIRAGRQ